MRYLAVLAFAVLIAGCGSSSSSSPPRRSTDTPAKHAPPKMTINRNATYTAQMQTTDGTFTIQLLPKLAPIAVNNFVHLAKTHFYDGVKFWRIISQFMVQTGDPTGTGTGGPGYTFKDEIHRKLRYGVGTVAMANSGPNTNGSQFFIVTGPGGSGLPPNYTIFGKVTSGMKTVRRIAMTPVGPNPYLSNNGQAEMSGPLKTVKITHITIHQS